MGNSTDDDLNTDAVNESGTKRSTEHVETGEGGEGHKQGKACVGNENGMGGGDKVMEIESVNEGKEGISVMSSTLQNRIDGEEATPVLTNSPQTPVNNCHPEPTPPPRPRRKSSALQREARHGEEEAPEKLHTENKRASKEIQRENKVKEVPSENKGTSKEIQRENKKVKEVHSGNQESVQETLCENQEAFKQLQSEIQEEGEEVYNENKENQGHEMQNMKDPDAARERERILKKTSYVNRGYTETKENEQNQEQRHDTRNRYKPHDDDKEGKGNSGKEKVLEEEDEDTNLVGLKKELSFANCVGMMVGGIIGTGIFVSPRGVLRYTGSVGMSLIVWASSGVMAILGALCYAELGTMIPQSGGNYTYLYEAYGSFISFLYLWMMMTIGIPGSRAVAALTFANYVVQPFFPNDQKPPESALRMVGISLLFLLTYINSRRVRWATRVQDSMALTKVFALVVIIVVGLYHLDIGTTDNYEEPMAGTNSNPALVAGAFYHTFYAYEGWDSLNGIMEELKDPFRNMPRAIAVSLTCVITVYMLTNVAYFAVVPKELILNSPAVAVTFGDLSLGVMAWIIPIFVACSVSGALNGSTFNISRLLYVGARNGHLPRIFSFVHIQNNTPVFSLFFVAFMSMWMFVTSEVHILINYVSFAGSLMNLACISSFFWFRYKRPDLPRPIKVWIVIPILYFIFSFFLCVMPVVEQPLEVVAALIVLGTGIPVYYFLIHREKPKKVLTIIDKVTYMSQLVFMAVPEERAC